MEDQYYDIQRRTEIKDTARELRRKYLRYKDAELVYSIQHMLQHFRNHGRHWLCQKYGLKMHERAKRNSAN